MKEKVLTQKEQDNLRFKKHRATLHQQTIIEFAYAIRMLVEPAAKSHVKLYFEEANCLTSVFYSTRAMLKVVDQEYLNQHADVVKFYQEKRELDNSWDRLNWVNKLGEEIKAVDEKNESPF